MSTAVIDHMGQFGWTWMGFGMLLFWGFVILGIVALIRYLQNSPTTRSDGSKTPLTVLQERYAKGEIQREEYEQKRRDLQQ